MNAMLPSFVPTLGWALIHFLWQGALVGMAAASALMLLRNARPQARYAVCCAALLLCMALPIAGVWRGLHANASVADVPIIAASASSTALSMELSDQASVALAASWRSTLQGQLPWIVALWSIGAGLLAARMALGMMWVGRIGRSRSGATHPRWQARLDRLAEMFGIERDVRLRVVDDLDSPVAAGWWRPMVLVPAALGANMPLDLLEALLAHELAHIKRHDYLINLVQSAIEALLFYHPVVWWLSKQIRIEREQIADDLAAQALGEPHRLALALQQLDQYQLDHVSLPASTLAPAANGGLLMSRIQRLIRPNQHALSWKMALPIIGLAAACLTAYAHDNTPVAATAIATAAPVAVTSTTPAATAVTAAAPATRASATTSTPAKARAAHASGHRGDAYAVVRAGHDGITMSADSRDIPSIEQAKQKVHGDFVWVRRGDKSYVVMDPAVIARIVDAWKPAEALGKQMDALGAKMEIPSKQLEELGKRMEAISANGRPYDAEMEKISAQMEALGRKQEAIGMKMGDVGTRMALARAQQRDTLEQQMEALRTQMEPLRQQMETLGATMRERAKAMAREQVPMEEIRRQMEQASLPMKALGKQLEALGEQEKQLGHDADRTVQELLDQALQDGKAEPADMAAPN